MLKVASALGAAGLLVSLSAQAHFTILAPPPADTATDGGKGAAPCGPVQDSNVVTPAQGGHPLMLQINETVFHPGFYRVALALDAQTDLPADSIVKDKAGNLLAPDGNGLSEAAAYELMPTFPVLADGLFRHDMEQMLFQTELTLPNVTCDKCTLQVVEFMSNHEASFFYHHCALLKITADPMLPAFNPKADTGGAPSMAFSNGSDPNASAGGVGGADTSGGTAGGGIANGGAAGGVGGSTSSGGSAPFGAGNASGSSSFPIAGSNAASGSSATPTSSGSSGGCSLIAVQATLHPAGLSWSSLLVLIVLRRRRATPRRRAAAVRQSHFQR